MLNASAVVKVSRVLTLMAAAALAFGGAPRADIPARQNGTPPYRNAALSPAQRADDLLSRMTLDEKIGQMAQADSNSLKPSDVAALHLGSVRRSSS